MRPLCTWIDVSWCLKMSSTAVPSAYSEKAKAQNWMAAVVASSMRAVLKRKEDMMVAPLRMGCTRKISRLSPNLKLPLTTASCR